MINGVVEKNTAKKGVPELGHLATIAIEFGEVNIFR